MGGGEASHERWSRYRGCVGACDLSNDLETMKRERQGKDDDDVTVAVKCL